MIDASERSNEECGDGTTTTSLIAGYLMKEGSKLMHGTGVNPIELRRGIISAVELICKELDKMTFKINV